MKTKKFRKKLDLNKKTIADLDSKAIGKIYGGRPYSFTTACVEVCVTCNRTCDITCGLTCGFTCDPTLTETCLLSECACL